MTAPMTLMSHPTIVKAPLLPQLATFVLLSLVWGLVTHSSSKADQLNEKESVKTNGMYVEVTAAILSLDTEVAKSLALHWLFDTGAGHPYMIPPDADDPPGNMAGIVTVSQYMHLQAIGHRVHGIQRFEELKIPNGSRGRIQLSDGDYIDVSASVPSDGMTADMSITLSKVNASSVDQTRKVNATVRDGQAVMLGELAFSGQPYTPTNNGVKLVLVRASIKNGDGKPVHDWQDRGGRRFYWDIKKPHGRPIIAPQSTQK